ncbi:MAG: glycosyltransferase [Chloroflexi bacterium]|nr:glycosyltransferase [Chloroflexota bacterium]
MKVLVGPLTAEEHERLLPLPRGGHDVLCFGPDEALTYRPGERWEELLARPPAGWWPDVVVWWSPEYRPWPVLDECPVMLVAVVGDWNLNFSALRQNLARCDYIVTDRAGVERFQALGYANVAFWANFSFHPPVHHPYPDLPPVYDVLFIGNLNHDVQRQRARLLARLARFAGRYRVAILGGLYGEEYARAVAQSRIVVNKSIRGEMNMRAYEAPACGALLFMERENVEVRDIFRDGVECVLYGEDDFEALLERYLEDEPRRARVAAAGHARVQREGYPAHLQALLDRLAAVDWPALRAQRERWAALDVAARHYHSGRWLAQTGYVPHLARDELATAARLAPDEPAYANALAVAEALLAAAYERAERPAEAARHAQAAEAGWRALLARWPDDALAWASLGLARLALGQREAGAAALSEALGLLCAAPDAPPSDEGWCFMHAYDTLRVEWERALALHAGDAEGARCALGGLLRWECARRLGELALAEGLAQRARELFALAIAARPDLEGGYAARGAALERLGDPLGAADDYAAALERQPWDFGTRRRLALVLYLVGQAERCAAVCREGLALAQVCPHYRDAARPLEGLLAQIVPLAVAEGGM